MDFIHNWTYNKSLGEDLLGQDLLGDQTEFGVDLKNVLDLQGQIIEFEIAIT